MKTLFSIFIILSLTILLSLTGCNVKSSNNSQSGKIDRDTLSSKIRQPISINDSVKQNVKLTKIYSQAIGDYIRLVNKEYKLTFDTLFFGKHVNG